MAADVVAPSRSRAGLAIAAAVAATVPALTVRLGGLHPEPLVAAVIFGIAVVGAAFMLAWAAEVVQLDISAGLALGPARARRGAARVRGRLRVHVEGGKEPARYAPDALANMTGGNQLLIGVGGRWSCWSRRTACACGGARPASPRPHVTILHARVGLSRTHSVEIAFLVLATVYGLTLPLHRTLTLLDSALLVGIFAWYIARVARAPAETPHLVGPALCDRRAAARPTGVWSSCRSSSAR